MRTIRGLRLHAHIDDVTDRHEVTTTREGTTTEPISWATIAAALGVSRQTAWQRFRHALD